jgi:MFS family permease
MILYEFRDPKDLIDACECLKSQRVQFGLYSPLPEDKLIEDYAPSTSLVSYMAIGGAILGALAGFLLQYYTNVYDYPHNIGGKPLNSWPAFLIITFELGVLCCGLGLLGSFIILNKYPRFDREVFGLKEFNERRHENYFISTQKEIPNVKANGTYHLPDEL